MGLVHSRDRFLVVQSVQTHKNQKWLTLGTTASSSSSGTCTTLTAMVHWTRTTSNAWPFVTPSLKARASGMRPLSRRTKRSWLTCGTRSLSWLILTRTMKSALKNLKRLFRPTAKAKHSLICLQPSKPLLTPISEPLTLTVTVPLALPNSELTAEVVKLRSVNDEVMSEVGRLTEELEQSRTRVRDLENTVKLLMEKRPKPTS